jgi:prepilin-type N-terminal cleavage/methylation domain-containing protein
MRALRRGNGFTLLELLIVVLLMALLGGLFMPNLGGSFAFRIRDAAREVAGELAYTAQRATATGLTQRLQVNLDQQVFRIEQLHETWAEDEDELPTHAELLDLAPPRPSREYQPVSNKSGEWRRLKAEEVRIDEIRLGDERSQSDVVGIAFAPDGGADPAEIWLLDENGLELRLRIVAFTGEVRIEEVTRE